MKNLIFRIWITIFFCTGVFVFGTLIIASINELLLLSIEPVIEVPVEMFEIYLLVFKIAGVMVLITGIGLMINRIVAAYDERQTVKEGQEIVLIAFAMYFITFGLPVIAFAFQGNVQKILIWLGVFFIGWLMVGRYGNKVSVPACMN